MTKITNSKKIKGQKLYFKKHKRHKRDKNGKVYKYDKLLSNSIFDA